MHNLSIASQIILYALLVTMALYCILLFGWQIMVLKGKAMKNPDGSVDSWHEQKTHYGIALADVYLSCPVNIFGTILIFIEPQWGFFLMSMVSFWWVWSNVMTTATSLKFENPQMTLAWFITFPFGAFVGSIYILWTVMHFDIVYLH